MQQLTVAELQTFCQRQTATAQLLDVREPWELALASLRVPGTTALDIPMSQLAAQLAEIDRSRPVVCICHHGGRSAQVVASLMRIGFVDVYNLAGGIDAWSIEVDPRVPRY